LYHVYLYRYQIAWEEKKFNKVLVLGNLGHKYGNNLQSQEVSSNVACGGPKARRILYRGPESWDPGQCTASFNACKSTAAACCCILGSLLWLLRELGSLQPWRDGQRGMLLKEACRCRSAAPWAFPVLLKLESQQSGRCSQGCSSAPRSP